MNILIDRRKLSEHLASHLEAWILSGQLKPGDRLPTERELQEQFSVGRPAVREALIMLQKSGLVEISNGLPARVRMPTAASVLENAVPAVLQMLSDSSGQKHFQHVRRLFESSLARHAASTASVGEIAELRLALEANQAAIGDRDRFVVTDIAFHLRIASIMKNPIIDALHEAMTAWLKQQRYVSLASPGQEQIAFEAHSRIFAAIAARNVSAADMAMREHLEQLETAFWAMEPIKAGGDIEPSP